MNKVILKGRIGQAPRISMTQNGQEIATFSIATSTSWKDGAGEWQSHTDWHKVFVVRKSTLTWIKDILRQGDTVYVEGKLTYTQWTDKHNQSRSTPLIVISGSEGRLEYIRSRKAEISPSNSPRKEQDTHPHVEKETHT